MAPWFFDMAHMNRFLCVLALCWMTIRLTGCQPEEPIREYIVDRPPAEGSLWFFKVLGPADHVAAQVDALRHFAESVTFDSQTGTPRWSLPEGWNETTSGSSMRFKTLKLPGEGGLELAVSPIRGLVPPSEDEWRRYVNMLRSQVGLEEIEEQDDWRKQAESRGEIKSIEVDQHSGLFLDYSGETTRFGKTRLLAVIVPVPFQQKPDTPGTKPSQAEMPFAFTVPKEWEDAPQTTFSLFSKQRVVGDQKVKITITPAMGGVLANVNRWRNQVGLPPLTKDQLTNELELLGSKEQPLLYIESIGESRGILGAIAIGGDGAWFFKLDGDPELVRKERERYRTFLESICAR